MDEHTYAKAKEILSKLREAINEAGDKIDAAKKAQSSD